MIGSTYLGRFIGGMVMLVLATLPARADLQTVAQFFGNISLSVDAEGNNNAAGGTIQVQKPSGATVRAAFLMANSMDSSVIESLQTGMLHSPARQLLGIGPNLTIPRSPHHFSIMFLLK